MAREKKSNNETDIAGRLTPRNITSEMRESYLDYAMSVITARALPDVRDGLKPVHRRILFAMHEMGLSPSARFRKSAAVVGEVLGKYHPHGDMAVYDSMVKMAQPFTYRYPLVLGQGNFGSIDGDSAAAMRYSEAKMSRLASEMLRDLEKETVDWRPNYDDTRREPLVFPAAVPQLLLNGTLGIAVGMATNIPPHNLREVVNATIHLIDHPDASVKDLLAFVKGPDFPTGAIAFSSKDIAHAHTTGRGGVVVRGEAEIVEGPHKNSLIVISSFPYRVNKAEFVSKVATLVRDKKLEGVKALRDESARGETRVVVELKSSTQPQKVLNYLYKHAEIETTFHYNMLALVDGVPQTLSLKDILEYFIRHREDVIRRRARYELSKAEERAHILEGLKKALDNIDKVISEIKRSADTATAHKNLTKKFRLSSTQATAILEMRLQKLAGLERKQIADELKEKKRTIKELKVLLGSVRKIRAVMKDELGKLVEVYGDERRTKIVKSGVKSLSVEDLIPKETNVLVLTRGGYIKRANPDEYRRQKRGGIGAHDLNTKEEDFVIRFLPASTHANILFFTNKGKVYQTKMYDIPAGKRATRGKSVMNFLPLSQDEYITSVREAPIDKESSKQFLLVMVTRNGIIKKVPAEYFWSVRPSGIIAIKLKKDDVLLASFFVEKGDDIIIATAGGQSIRFHESKVRAMGRSAAGVRALSLRKGDLLVSADAVKKSNKNPSLLILTEKGFGKKTSLKEYRIQSRGGSGIKTARLTDKTGKLVVAKVVTDEFSELVVISRMSHIIRLGLKEIPTLGRNTQGVRVMKLRANDRVATFICL